SEARKGRSGVVDLGHALGPGQEAGIAALAPSRGIERSPAEEPLPLPARTELLDEPVAAQKGEQAGIVDARLFVTPELRLLHRQALEKTGGVVADRLPDRPARALALLLHRLLEPRLVHGQPVGVGDVPDPVERHA